MRMWDTKHGVGFRPDGGVQSWVEVVTSDDRVGLVLLVGTEHDAVEVRITPQGRKVTTHGTSRRPPFDRHQEHRDV